MRRFVLIGLALVLAGCGSDSPTNPSNQPVVFTVQLSAGAEVPAAAAADANGTGTATITFSVPRDSSGNVTGGGIWNAQANVSGLASDSTIILSHIHTGATGVRGGVYVDTGLTAANAIALTNGAGVVNFTNVAITQEQAQTVMNNPSGHYFNMHTPASPGGAVRGQLVRQ